MNKPTLAPAPIGARHEHPNYPSTAFDISSIAFRLETLALSIEDNLYGDPYVGRAVDDSKTPQLSMYELLSSALDTLNRVEALLQGIYSGTSRG